MLCHPNTVSVRLCVLSHSSPRECGWAGLVLVLVLVWNTRVGAEAVGDGGRGGEVRGEGRLRSETRMRDCVNRVA